MTLIVHLESKEECRHCNNFTLSCVSKQVWRGLIELEGTLLSGEMSNKTNAINVQYTITNTKYTNTIKEILSAVWRNVQLANTSEVCGWNRWAGTI